MNKRTSVAIIIALLLIAAGTAVYVISRQREAARLEQIEHARQEAQAAQEYHEARKKTGEFLMPDTKSRMRFDEGATPQPTRPEKTK